MHLLRGGLRGARGAFGGEVLLRVWGLGLRIEGLGLRVKGVCVEGRGLRVLVKKSSGVEGLRIWGSVSRGRGFRAQSPIKSSTYCLLLPIKMLS